MRNGLLDGFSPLVGEADFGHSSELDCFAYFLLPGIFGSLVSSSTSSVIDLINLILRVPISSIERLNGP
jgi:hypothetical protein